MKSPERDTSSSTVVKLKLTQPKVQDGVVFESNLKAAQHAASSPSSSKVSKAKKGKRKDKNKSKNKKAKKSKKSKKSKKTDHKKSKDKAKKSKKSKKAKKSKHKNKKHKNKKHKSSSSSSSSSFIPDNADASDDTMSSYASSSSTGSYVSVTKSTSLSLSESSGEDSGKKTKKNARKKKKKKKKEEEEDDAGITFRPKRKRLFQDRGGTGAGSYYDFTNLRLKADHAKRPIWVTSKGHIYLEAFSPLYEIAYEFLIAVAVPVCRARLIQEYRLDSYSLYAAVSIGLDDKKIVRVLNNLSKTEIPVEVVEDVRNAVANYGKTKIVLRENMYFLEATDKDILLLLLEDPVIYEAALDVCDDEDLAPPEENHVSYLDAVAAAAARAASGSSSTTTTTSTTTSNKEQQSSAARELAERIIKTYTPGSESALDAVIDATETHGANGGNGGNGSNVVDHTRVLEEMEERTEDGRSIYGDESVDAHTRYAFEFHPDAINDIRQRANMLNFPALEEYDFRNDSVNASLDVHLKPMTSIRPYQEKALRKMFGNGRARSGIIVLPCGAGKTLVGITAATTIKKSTIVLCTSAVAVEQWKRQFELWTQIDPALIVRFTSSDKDMTEVVRSNDKKRPLIVISTFSMIAYTGKRTGESKRAFEYIKSREWGLLVLDEVQVAPAKSFSKVATLKAHCKLGLTATLVREDGKISDLDFLVGAKLFEANWMDLQDQGYIARVQCVEVQCEMSPMFYREYLKAPNHLRKLLYIMNPQKFLATAFLIDYHAKRGDKILVFSDNVFALQQYSDLLKIPLIYGKTSSDERIEILEKFQHHADVPAIAISKVGDNSIDLPGASVVIQVAAHYGSRRQEAQRLGRILRAKSNTDGGFNAFFYSVVSKDTQEMYYSTKRQQFLVNQGYSFKVVTHLPDRSRSHHLATVQGQRELLTRVLRAKAEDGATELYDHDDDARTVEINSRRRSGNMSSLSTGGAENTVYTETGRSGVYAPYSRRAGPGRKKRRKPATLAASAVGTIFEHLFKKKKLTEEEKEMRRAAKKKKIKYLPDDDV